MTDTNKILSALYGLKYHPFTNDVPVEALWVPPQVESFCLRVLNQVGQGGFALITGDNGLGKSVGMRVSAARTSTLRDVTLAEIEHPPSGVTDFYRKLGHAFQVQIGTCNRWGGFKTLRERWKAHLDQTLYRPVIYLDEVQETPSVVLTELRLLTSEYFDSRSLLTVVFGGDLRFLERLTNDRNLVPLAKRIRVKTTLAPATPPQLAECVRHRLEHAGNPNLMTPELIATLCEHAAGNYRTLFDMATDLLEAAVAREAPRLDEKLFFEAYVLSSERARPKAASAGRGR